jgi:hypothetical protein
MRETFSFWRPSSITKLHNIFEQAPPTLYQLWCVLASYKICTHFLRKDHFMVLVQLINPRHSIRF